MTVTCPCVNFAIAYFTACLDSLSQQLVQPALALLAAAESPANGIAGRIFHHHDALSITCCQHFAMQQSSSNTTSSTSNTTSSTRIASAFFKQHKAQPMPLINALCRPVDYLNDAGAFGCQVGNPPCWELRSAFKAFNIWCDEQIEQWCKHQCVVCSVHHR